MIKLRQASYYIKIQRKYKSLFCEKTLDISACITRTTRVYIVSHQWQTDSDQLSSQRSLVSALTKFPSIVKDRRRHAGAIAKFILHILKWTKMIFSLWLNSVWNYKIYKSFKLV